MPPKPQSSASPPSQKRDSSGQLIYELPRSISQAFAATFGPSIANPETVGNRVKSESFLREFARSPFIVEGLKESDNDFVLVAQQPAEPGTSEAKPASSLSKVEQGRLLLNEFQQFLAESLHVDDVYLRNAAAAAITQDSSGVGDFLHSFPADINNLYTYLLERHLRELHDASFLARLRLKTKDRKHFINIRGNDELIPVITYDQLNHSLCLAFDDFVTYRYYDAHNTAVCKQIAEVKYGITIFSAAQNRLPEVFYQVVSFKTPSIEVDSKPIGIVQLLKENLFFIPLESFENVFVRMCDIEDTTPEIITLNYLEYLAEQILYFQPLHSKLLRHHLEGAPASASEPSARAEVVPVDSNILTKEERLAIIFLTRKITVYLAELKIRDHTLRSFIGSAVARELGEIFQGIFTRGIDTKELPDFIKNCQGFVMAELATFNPTTFKELITEIGGIDGIPHCQPTPPRGKKLYLRQPVQPRTIAQAKATLNQHSSLSSSLLFQYLQFWLVSDSSNPEIDRAMFYCLNETLQVWQEIYPNDSAKPHAEQQAIYVYILSLYCELRDDWKGLEPDALLILLRDFEIKCHELTLKLKSIILELAFLPAGAQPLRPAIFNVILAAALACLRECKSIAVVEPRQQKPTIRNKVFKTAAIVNLQSELADQITYVIDDKQLVPNILRAASGIERLILDYCRVFYPDAFEQVKATQDPRNHSAELKKWQERQLTYDILRQRNTLGLTDDTTPTHTKPRALAFELTEQLIDAEDAHDASAASTALASSPSGAAGPANLKSADPQTMSAITESEQQRQSIVADLTLFLTLDYNNSDAAYLPDLIMYLRVFVNLEMKQLISVWSSVPPQFPARLLEIVCENAQDLLCLYVAAKLLAYTNGDALRVFMSDEIHAGLVPRLRWLMTTEEAEIFNLQLRAATAEESTPVQTQDTPTTSVDVTKNFATLNSLLTELEQKLDYVGKICRVKSPNWQFIASLIDDIRQLHRYCDTIFSTLLCIACNLSDFSAIENTFEEFSERIRKTQAELEELSTLLVQNYTPHADQPSVRYLQGLVEVISTAYTQANEAKNTTLCSLLAVFLPFTTAIQGLDNPSLQLELYCIVSRAFAEVTKPKQTTITDVAALRTFMLQRATASGFEKEKDKMAVSQPFHERSLVDIIEETFQSAGLTPK